MDYNNIINTEIGGLYGSELIKEMNEIIKLYKIYDKGEEWELDELDYTPTVKKTNYIKKLIKDEARFMFSKTPTFTIENDSEEATAKVQEYIDGILEKNLFSSKLVNAGKDAFIGKRVAIKLHADTVTKTIRIMFVPSLEFVYEPFEDRVDELKKIIFFHAMNDEQDKDKQIIWKQKYEMIEGKCILNEGFYDGSGALIEALAVNQDLKLSGIPAYVILNDGLSGDLKGESDVEEIKDNALAYNKLSSEDIDTLRKGMNQIIYGTDVSSEASKLFKLKAGSYWDVQTEITQDGKQAQIGTIEANFGYDARMQNTLGNIKNDMYETLSIPFINLADMQGAITSGKGMKALYWKLITRCEEKWATWKPALTWMIDAILEMTEVYNIEPVPKLDNVRILVNNQYPLQEDEDEAKALDMNAVLNQVMSRKSYMKKWGLTNDLADEELKQIALEREMLEDSYSGMGGLNGE